MTRKIGSIIDYAGWRLQVVGVDGDEHCLGCYFHSKCGYKKIPREFLGECFYTERSDHKSVVFRVVPEGYNTMPKKLDLSHHVSTLYFFDCNAIVQKVFRDNRIETIKDLVSLSVYSLRNMNGIGGWSISVIRETLGFFGLWMGMTKENIESYETERNE